MKRSIKKWY